MNPGVQQYLTVDETCELFRMSRSTFYELVRTTDLSELLVRVPPPSGRLRVPSRDFERWLKEQS